LGGSLVEGGPLVQTQKNS